MARDAAQAAVEKALERLIANADGAVSCHLMGLEDADLLLLKDPMRAAEATVAVWMAMGERLGYPPRTMAPEVLETFVELLETERGLEAQRRSGGGGFYPPSLAAAMAGFLRNGREGLDQALEQFPALNDYERDRFSHELPS